MNYMSLTAVGIYLVSMGITLSPLSEYTGLGVPAFIRGLCVMYVAIRGFKRSNNGGE